MRLLVVIAILIAVSGCGGPSRNAWYNSPDTQNQQTTARSGEESTQSSWCASLDTDAPIKEVSITEIATMLHGGNFTKGEFETTADYERRLNSRLEKVRQLVNRSTGTNRVIFSVPIPDYKTQYNADTGLMVIGREYSGLLSVNHSSVGELIVTKSSQQTVGTYIGENAFGVKKRIARIQGYDIGFNAPEGSLGGWPSSLGAGSFKPLHVYMPQDEARRAKTDLSVLFVGQMQSPYLKQGTDRFTPKINAPFDRTIVSQAVQLQLECAAIYNRATKKVLQPLPLARARRMG